VDRNTLIVLALTAALYFGWQASLDRRFPNRHEKPVATAPAAVPPGVERGTPSPSPEVPGASQPPAVVSSTAPVREFVIEKPLYRAVFTSSGGALKEWVLTNYDDKSRAGSPQVAITMTGPGQSSLTTPFLSLGAGDLSGASYVATQPRGDELEFATEVAGVAIRKTYRFDPEGYGARLAIEVTNRSDRPVSPDFRLQWPARLGSGADFTEFGLAAYANDEVVSFPIAAMPSFLGFGGGAADEPVSIVPDADAATFELDWAGAQTRYFLAAIVPDKPRDARAELLPTDVGREARADVWFEPVALPPGASLVREYRLYFGPKESDRLDAMGSHLDEAIQKGWVPWLTRFFTGLLTTTYKLIPNYGVAILLLTLVIRVVLAPLMVGQMRSMKRMADLAPKIKASQERFPDDRAKQQEAMMAVYREAGVSPFSMFGGCLPMLLQLPVFVGFYSALHGSIQLRQQPFFGWIRDLSQPESLFVIPGLDLHVRLLPLLLGASMVLQQRLTPMTTMDPAQARMMQIVMPVMFTVMFYQFASGLGLYWLMSTLLGIAQQVLMNRQPSVGKA
jgi:YidC/Oxa1 family membrane protein insertase